MSATIADPGVDRWVCLPATWEVYTGLLEARGERGRPRYTYLDGRLTVVSPGVPHEALTVRLAGLIQEVVVGLSIDCQPTGQVTLLRSRRSPEGTEADASYYLNHLDFIRGKRKLVMGQDPPPDLVIEVVVSHAEGDALEAYRRFGVPEVWVCKESGLEFLVLGADGRYAVSSASACLPFLRSDELAPWVYRDDPSGDTRVLKQFRAWVETTLAPRLRPEEGR